jgi:hypothetical protein
LPPVKLSLVTKPDELSECNLVIDTLASQLVALAEQARRASRARCAKLAQLIQAAIF